MIRYALICAHDHGFEAWFSSSSDYDAQVERGLVECPFCGSVQVGKQIMAPSIARGLNAAPSPPDGKQIRQALAEVRRHVESTFDYVGDRFAREARDIHEGVSPARAVYGEATQTEVRALIADGVPVAPLPLPPMAAPDKKQLN